MINLKRLKMIFCILYLSLICIYPVFLYIEKDIESQFPEASQPNYDFYRTDKYIAYDGYYSVYGYMSSGRVMYGYIESDHTTEYYDFFICDESNFNSWVLGGVPTRYQFQSNAHALEFSFTAPYSANWYVVIDNVASSGIYMDMYIDYDTNNKPHYDVSSYDFVINDKKLEPGEYYALSLGYLTTRDNLQIFYSTYFDSDYCGVYLLSNANYIAFTEDGSYTAHYSWSSSSVYANTIQVYFDDTYYLVFSAKYVTDTVRFGAGVSVQVGYYSNWFLDYGIYGLIVIGIVSGVIVGVQVRKRKGKSRERKLEDLEPSKPDAAVKISETKKTIVEKSILARVEEIPTPAIKKIDVLPIMTQKIESKSRGIAKEGWYCALCGKWNAKSSGFCGRCGTRLGIQFK